MKKTGNNSKEQLSGIFRADFSMMPLGPKTVFIRDRIMMDDNLDPEDGPFPLARLGEEGMEPVMLRMGSSIFCKEGTLKLVLDQLEYTLEKNDFISIKAGTLLTSVKFSTSPVCRIAMSVMPMGIHKSTPSLIPQKSVLAFMKLIYNTGNVVKIKMGRATADLYLSMYLTNRKLMQFVDPDYIDEAVIYYLSTVATVVATVAKKSKTLVALSERDRNKDVFRSFMENVRQNCSVERSVSFYAEKACMSPKYFSGVISESSGHNPTYWIKTSVILEAKALLSSGKYTIQQTSSRLNFPNPSFFCKYFKSGTGMSPGEYVKSMK